MRNCSYSSPPGPNKHLAAHSSAWLSPKNPAADPAPRPGLQSPSSRMGPGDLIVLKHSSYHLIFLCPLSLVSYLHICWNTLGCLLCSSDQLGVSLVLRGSGLRSHLSCRHLPRNSFKTVFFFFFLQLSSIPLCKSPIVVLSTHLLMDTCTASIS